MVKYPDTLPGSFSLKATSLGRDPRGTYRNDSRALPLPGGVALTTRGISKRAVSGRSFRRMRIVSGYVRCAVTWTRSTTWSRAPRYSPGHHTHHPPYRIARYPNTLPWMSTREAHIFVRPPYCSDASARYQRHCPHVCICSLTPRRLLTRHTITASYGRDRGSHVAISSCRAASAHSLHRVAEGFSTFRDRMHGSIHAGRMRAALQQLGCAELT